MTGPDPVLLAIGRSDPFALIHGIRQTLEPEFYRACATYLRESELIGAPSALALRARNAVGYEVVVHRGPQWPLLQVRQALRIPVAELLVHAHVAEPFDEELPELFPSERFSVLAPEVEQLVTRLEHTPR